MSTQNSASVNSASNSINSINKTNKEQTTMITLETKINAAFNFSNMILSAKDLSEDVLYTMIDMALPNNVNPEIDSVNYNRMADKQDALLAFCQKYKFQLVPTPEQLVIIYRKGEAQIPSAATAVMTNLSEFGFGTEFIYAVQKNVKGKLVVTSSQSTKNLLLKGGKSVAMSTYNALNHEAVPHVFADQFASWLMVFVANQLSNLTAAQKYELLSIFPTHLEAASDNNPTGGLAIKDGTNNLAFDFATREVSKSTASYTATKSISVANQQIDSTAILFTMMTNIAHRSFSGKSVSSLLATLPNLWERDPGYGVDLDSSDPTRLLMDNTCLPLVMHTSKVNVWPWVLPMNSKFDLAILETFLAEGKAVVLDKYGLQFAGNETAANAGLLGRRILETADGIVDEFLTLHDAAKESKFFNRLTQARKHLKAAVEGRTSSAFRVVLPNGNEAMQSGVKLNTILTNSRLCSGSGPAFVNPNLRINTSVKKSLSFTVSYDRLAKSVRDAIETSVGKPGDKEAGMAVLQQKIEDKINSIADSGKIFTTGETILSLLGNTLVLLKNTALNQPLKVIGVKKTNYKKSTEKGYVSDSFSVQVEVELVVNDNWFKLRNDGFKLTTLPYNVTFLKGEQPENAIPYAQDWDIILNLETQKGKLCQVVTYILAHGGGVYNPNTGILTMDNGQVIDLVEKENAVYEWVKANTKTIYLEMEMARAEYDMLVKYGPTSDIYVVKQDEDVVVVRETVQALLPIGGTYQHYEVEISTPRENTGKCGMTPEQLASMALQNKRLAEVIHEESRTRRAGVMSLVNMITKTNAGQEIDLSSQAVRSSLVTTIGSLDGLKDGQIVDKYAKAFSNGVVFKATSTSGSNAVKSLFVDFNVLRSMSVFIGGNAGDELSSAFVSFLNFLVNLPEKSVDSAIYSKLSNLRLRLDAWLEKAAQSQGILKKAARSAEICVTGKVRTMYSKQLNHKEGMLPKVMLNPNCAMVSELGVKEGDLVAIGRTPMPMLTVCQVVLSGKVGIAHAGLLPHIWAMSNEGDSDGDGLFLINLSLRGVNEEEAHIMNNHFMGMRGYTYVYGEDPSGWPCAEFSSFGDKHGKKAIVVPAKYEAAYITRKSAEWYVEAANKVSSHYRGAVGIAYGICSALTFRAAELVYRKEAGHNVDNYLKLHERALAVVWRLCYEGLGLAGYTENAKLFFDVLNVAVWSPNYLIEDGKVIRPSKTKVYGKDQLLPCIPTLVKCLGLGHLKPEMASAIVRLILEGELIRQNRSAIEKGRERVKYLSNSDIEETAVLMGLRTMGQGRNDAGSAELEARYSEEELDEVTPTSLFTIIQTKELAKKQECFWLGELLNDGTVIHTSIAKYLFDLKLSREDEAI